MSKRILVTGGSGFIGTHLVKMLLEDERVEYVVNLDKLTYASNDVLESEFLSTGKYCRQVFDICDTPQVLKILKDYEIDDIMHLAAESHVDNSISDSKPFVLTNVLGTVSLLDAFNTYTGHNKDSHRFIHVSTDEVFGSLGERDLPFYEFNPLNPRNPYSASKAAAEHFVRAYGNTHGIDFNITNCSNNFGPYQHGEKLIPTVVRSFMTGKSVPVYGKGENIRDWVYVKDHCRALIMVLFKGVTKETYCIGGSMELSNIRLIETIFSILQTKYPNLKKDIQYVMDRKGHDLRYAICDSKITHELGPYKEGSFRLNLEETVLYYAKNYK